MHELSYMLRFVEMAENEIQNEPNAVIRSITVEVGELTGVLPEYLEKYFPEVIAQTRHAGASLHVNRIPVEAVCAACGTHYHPDRDNDYRCPACRSADASIVRGRELDLVRVELAVPT